MRGKATGELLVGCLAGITPAYAGKSADIGQVVTLFEGSPPPMRGKGYCRGSADPVFGITPAYAGKRIRRRATKDDW